MKHPLIVAVLERLLVALIGYTVFFTAYLVIFHFVAAVPVTAQNTWHVTQHTLALPFTDALANAQTLSKLRWSVPKPGREAFVALLRHDLRIALATEAILFIALIAGIIIFERSHRKTARSIALFYAVVPALLWILWSQSFLLI